jgi:hypothetical protein
MIENLTKRLKRIAEKQYRKGFQQGFHACLDKKLTAEQVSDWRHQGSKRNYSESVDPFTGKQHDILLDIDDD